MARMDILIFGIINGFTLSLIALGFTFTFGISGVANFAYGAIYILGALLTWFLFSSVGLPYLVAIVISVVVMGLFGFALYWAVLLRLRGIVLNEIIATFAIGMAILQFLRWMGFVGYEYKLPPFIKGYTVIAGYGVEYQRVFIAGVCAAMVLILYLITHYTRVGLAFRGISQDEHTAISLGIDSDWMGALALASGCALATVAAVTILPLGVIDIDEGFKVIIIALAVGIVGGLVSIPGVILAGFALGFSQQIVATFFGPGWTMVIFMAAILVILTVKPSGILGKFKELEERI
jgi:branched-chain amino acid transport system permease protein